MYVLLRYFTGVILLNGNFLISGMRGYISALYMWEVAPRSSESPIPLQHKFMLEFKDGMISTLRGGRETVYSLQTDHVF